MSNGGDAGNGNGGDRGSVTPAPGASLPLVVPKDAAGVVIEVPLEPQRKLGRWTLLAVVASLGVIAAVSWLVIDNEPGAFRMLAVAIGLMMLAAIWLLVLGAEMALAELRIMRFERVEEAPAVAVVTGAPLAGIVESVGTFASALKGLRTSVAALLLGTTLLGSAGFLAAWRADSSILEVLTDDDDSDSDDADDGSDDDDDASEDDGDDDADETTTTSR